MIVIAIFLLVLSSTTGKTALPASRHDSAEHLPGSQVIELSIGGRMAEKGQFPFQVSIQAKYMWYWNHFCGGSLISHHTVLTAAHCTTAYSLSSIRIVAGEYDLSQDEGTEQIRIADQVIAHPHFNSSGPFDIAIYHLARPFEFNKHVKPIKLAHQMHFPIGNAILSGWGLTIRDRDQGTTSDVLRAEVLPLLDDASCKAALEKIHISMLPDSILCVGPLNGEMGPCYGDSGGPLVQNGVLIGIASFVTHGCAHVGSPSGFTRVSAYTDWILQEDKNMRLMTWTPDTTTIGYYNPDAGGDEDGDDYNYYD